MRHERPGGGIDFDPLVSPRIQVTDGVAAEYPAGVIEAAGGVVLGLDEPQRDPARTVDEHIALDDRVARATPEEDRRSGAEVLSARTPDSTKDIVANDPAFAVEHIDAVGVI